MNEYDLNNRFVFLIGPQVGRIQIKDLCSVGVLAGFEIATFRWTSGCHTARPHRLKIGVLETAGCIVNFYFQILHITLRLFMWYNHTQSACVGVLNILRTVVRAE